tara:strand:- start:693 stop:1322 length:630 start_codon:yes stop_codon:yes gene_type:complete
MNDTISINKVFSTPVLQTKPFTFPKEELDIIDEERNITMDNYGKNFSSKNTYVLKRLPTIYDFCNHHLQVYAKEVMKVVPNIQFYITQSWLNYNPKNSYHHAHYHPNSLISGVLSIKNDSNVPIILDKPVGAKVFDNLLAMYDFTEMNEFNSPKISFDLPTGSLILFPSKFFHNVPINNNDGDRITLAFNSFLKGDLGGPEDFLGKLHI